MSIDIIHSVQQAIPSHAQQLGLDFIQLNTIETIIKTVPSLLIEIGGELDAIVEQNAKYSSLYVFVQDIPALMLKIKDMLNRSADTLMRCKMGRIDVLDFVKHVLYLLLAAGKIQTDNPVVFKENIEFCNQLLVSTVDIYLQKPVETGCSGFLFFK